MKVRLMFLVSLFVSIEAHADGLNSLQIDLPNDATEHLIYCSTQFSGDVMNAWCANDSQIAGYGRAPITNDSPLIKLTAISPHYDHVPGDGICVLVQVSSNSNINHYELNCGDVIFRNRFES